MNPISSIIRLERYYSIPAQNHKYLALTKSRSEVGIYSWYNQYNLVYISTQQINHIGEYAVYNSINVGFTYVTHSLHMYLISIIS